MVEALTLNEGVCTESQIYGQWQINNNNNGSEDVNKGTTLFYKDKFIRTLRLRFG